MVLYPQRGYLLRELPQGESAPAETEKCQYGLPPSVPAPMAEGVILQCLLAGLSPRRTVKIMGRHFHWA